MVDRKLSALEYHLQELSIAQGEGDREWEKRAYGHLGNAYYNLGDFQQAIEHYTQSLSIAKELGEKTWEGKVYGSLGNAYLCLGNFKQAIEYHKQHLSIAKDVRDRDSEGRAYGNLGVAHYRLGHYKQAVECHKQALTIAEDLGDRAREGMAYGNLGVAYTELGNFKQAIECHTQQLNIAKEVGDRGGEGKAYHNLGNAYRGLGSFKQAIEYYKQDLTIAKEVGDRAGEGITYGNLGGTYGRMGNFKQAIEYHTKQLNIAQQVGDRDGEGKAYNSLGNAYCCLGSFKQAIEYHKQDLHVAKELGNRAEEGIAYGNLGNVYDSLGDFKKAMGYHKQHLSIAKQVGNRPVEGMGYRNLGSAYYGLGSLKEAIESFQRSLSIAKEIGDKSEEGRAYGNLSNAFIKLGDFIQAMEFSKQYLRITKEIEDRAGEGTASGNLGTVYYSLGDYKQAIEQHKQHFIIAKEVGDSVGEGTACYMLGLDYESLASISEALDYYRSSIRLFDYTRALLQSEDAWKISFHDKNREVYTALWRIILKAGKADEALCAAEQGRAQALMDVLKRQYGVDSLLSRTVETKETILYILNDLSTQTVFVALHKHIISFWVLRNGNEIHCEMKEIEAGDAGLLMETTLQEIGAGVRVKCENRSMDELTDGPPSIGEDVGEKDKTCTPFGNSLRPLYDAIIGPIADLLHGDQLIVVPDGPFCLVPYSALSESTRIRVVPSLTTLQLIAGAPGDFHCKSGALLVGDPCLDDVPIHLSQLPYAKKEVEMIGKLLKTTPLTGKDATKDEVLKKLTSVALVHIAAHGCAQSGEIVLALNPGRKSQPPRRQDCILTMSDVQAVCLRARLVVLSCCHSGRGEVKSEGVVGIARSFLCAGARSVLVSLWAIDDEATMMFMESFYQHLSHGKSASVALHQAMKYLRESEKFSAVKYWAPFLLIGDDVTLEFGEQK